MLSKLGHPQRSNDVIHNFKMAAAAAPCYFQFRIWWCHSHPKVSKPNSSTYLNPWLRYNYFWFGITIVRHIEILLPVSISAISLQSTCHSAPVCEILSKSDRPRQKNDVVLIFKMADLRHLGFYGSNNSSLKSPCTTSYRSSMETIALNCLFFEKIAFFAFWRQTD